MSATSGRSARHRLLGALLDEADEPLLALDGNGKILECNRAAADLLQREQQHLIGKPLATAIAVEDRRRFREALTRLSRTQLAELQVQLVRGTADLAVAKMRLRLQPGNPPAVLANLRPSGGVHVHRPPAQREHFELERYLLRLPLGVIGIDSQGRVLFANGRARRLFAGTQLRRGAPLPPLGAKPRLHLAVERLVSERLSMQPRLFELPDGHILRVTGAGIREGAASLLVLDDVTSVLRDARMESAFVRNAAHQLRTPLAGIANAIEVLQSGAKDDPEARDRFLMHIERQCERLTRLTRALLVLARSQSGTQAPRLEFVPLEPVFEKLAAEVEPSRDVAIESVCSGDVAALAERDLLEEAISALLDNASRHTKRGTIALRAIRRDDRMVELEVQDSGEGILPEHREHIFEPFFRVQAEGSGFGLGLAIASQAVAAMGAELEVDSDPRHGTRFSFRLPSAEVVST